MFFAIGSIVGALGPVIYGALIGNGTNRTGLTIGYIIGGGIMIIGGLVEVAFGINAEGKATGRRRPATHPGRLLVAWHRHRLPDDMSPHLR